MNICADQWAENIRDTYCLDRDKSTSNILYDKGQVMVMLNDKRLIYGNINAHITHFSKQGIITYLKGKYTHWTNNIFEMVDWEGMGQCLAKMKDTKVTHVLKMVHGWQHVGNQK